MRRIAMTVLVASGLLWAECSSVSAYVEVSGVFIADDQCQALDSIRRESNPGTMLTVPGQSYNVRALNREDGEYVHVDVPNAVPRTRWVALACGELFREAEDAEPQRPDEREEPTTGLAPFFDTDDQPNDPTPRAPNLSAFDRAMLQVCGGWGSRPARAAFRSALDEQSLGPDVDRIYEALDGSILGPRRELMQFSSRRN
jgi:hypothetical protein